MFFIKEFERTEIQKLSKKKNSGEKAKRDLSIKKLNQRPIPQK